MKLPEFEIGANKTQEKVELHSTCPSLYMYLVTIKNYSGWWVVTRLKQRICLLERRELAAVAVTQVEGKVEIAPRTL